MRFRVLGTGLVQSALDFLKGLPGIKGIVDREHAKMLVLSLLLSCETPHNRRYTYRSCKVSPSKQQQQQQPAKSTSVPLPREPAMSQVKIRASINKHDDVGGEHCLELPSTGLPATQIKERMAGMVRTNTLCPLSACLLALPLPARTLPEEALGLHASQLQTAR